MAVDRGLCEYKLPKKYNIIQHFKHSWPMRRATHMPHKMNIKEYDNSNKLVQIVICNLIT